MAAIHEPMSSGATAETISSLAQLFEARLGGMMLVRLGMSELVERFKQEEHQLAVSLKTILQLRDEERQAFRAQLDSAHAYAHQLEAQLLEAQRLRSESLAAVSAAHAAPPPSAPVASAVASAVEDEIAAPLPAPAPAARAPARAEEVPALPGVGGPAEWREYPHPADPAMLPPMAAADQPAGLATGLAAGGNGAAEGADQLGYLARVQQLQQRLAQERRAHPSAKPGHKSPSIIAASALGPNPA